MCVLGPSRTLCAVMYGLNVWFIISGQFMLCTQPNSTGYSWNYRASSQVKCLLSCASLNFCKFLFYSSTCIWLCINPGRITINKGTAVDMPRVGTERQHKKPFYRNMHIYYRNIFWPWHRWLIHSIYNISIHLYLHSFCICFNTSHICSHLSFSHSCIFQHPSDIYTLYLHVHIFIHMFIYNLAPSLF